ncbi:MAG: hypothetical protein GY746_01630, partial [Gammaproteobacteria bacterium]|nr:hypothetical protein [Gammaproteobacteria bacterium]
MYGKTGEVVYVIGLADGDLENAKVMAGRIYNAHVSTYENIRGKYGSIIQDPMPREAYNNTPLFPSADESFSLDKPILRSDTQSVVIRRESARFEKSGLIVHESPIDLNSTDQGINSGDVLLKENGEIKCSTCKPPEGAEGTPTSIGYYAAFYTSWTALPDTPGKYNPDGRESLKGYDYKSHNDTLWGPVAHARVGFWGELRASADEKGLFRFFYSIPLSVGYSATYWNILIAQLQFEPFDPVTSSPGNYYLMHPVPSHYHSSSLHDLVSEDTVAGGLSHMRMKEDELKIRNEADMLYNFSVDVSVLAGEATMQNDTLHRNPPIPVSPSIPPGSIPFPDDNTETEYVYDEADFNSRPPGDLSLEMDLDGNRITDKTEYDNDGNVIKVRLGDSAPPEEPDLTRVPYRGPDITDQGLLKTISKKDLNNTDIYVYRLSGNRRIAVRKGIKPEESHYYYGTGTNEEEGGILISYHMLMRGPLSFSTYKNSPATFEQWRSRTGFRELPDPDTGYLRAGEKVKVIMINRAAGYIGTAVADVSLTKYNPSGDKAVAQASEIKGTTLISFTTGQRIVMRPPNLKIRAERKYKVERGMTAGTDREYIIGSEGSGLTGDTYIKITSEWYDHDGSPLPEDLEGYTGRLARVVDKNMKLGQPMITDFAVKPGRNTQIVNFPAGNDNCKAHYYIHINGRTAGADFSSTGAGKGALQYRPRLYVPFKVPIYDEAATLEAEMIRRRTIAALGMENAEDVKPVYRWVYRPEMQFSLFDLDVRKIEQTDSDEIPHLIMSDTAEKHLLDSPDKDIRIEYALSRDILPILPQFGPPREHLVFSIGGQEVRVFFDPAGHVILENTAHISLLEPEDYLAIRLFQNGDDPNVLWEYAFADIDLDIRMPKVIAGESPAKIPDRDELYKGSMTFVNLDNDDNDSVFDNKDSKVSGGDDEMVRLDLRLQPP